MNDIQQLSLSQSKQSQIRSIVQENKMDWEPWIESSSDFIELKSKLRKRGFKNFPLNDKPIIPNDRDKINQNTINKLPNQTSMMRRSRKSRI